MQNRDALLRHAIKLKEYYYVVKQTASRIVLIQQNKFFYILLNIVFRGKLNYMPAQNFKNHSQYVPLFHFVTMPILLVVLIGAIVNLVHSEPENVYSASLLVALTIAVFILAFSSRGFALKAQDRAIRAEENFRHYIGTGKPLDDSLRMGQIIALRFAGDDEFVALAKKAAAEKMSPKEIKTAINNWKGDHYRV